MLCSERQADLVQGDLVRLLQVLLLAMVSQVANQVREILLGCLQHTGIATQLSFARVPTTLQDKVCAFLQIYDLGPSYNELEKYATVGVIIAATAYKHTPLDVQASIAFYTLLSTDVDDDIAHISSIAALPVHSFDGPLQTHPVMTFWVNVITRMSREFFLPFSANILTTNSIDFVSVEMLARDKRGDGPDVRNLRVADYEDGEWAGR